MKGGETDDTLLYLNRSDVERLCQQLDPVALMREAFALHGTNGTALPAESCLRWTFENERLRSLAMPGRLDGRFDMSGIKIINSNPANLERNLPRADGLTLLFDSRTARVRCVLDAAPISALRTAAVSILSCQLLGRPDMSHAALLGTGVQAQAHAKLIARYLPGVCSLNLFDVSPARALHLHARLHGEGMESIVTASPEEAVRTADLVITATTTTTSYLPYAWLKPGALVINVSLDDVAEDVFLNCSVLVVDDECLVRQDDQRLLGRMMREGRISTATTGHLPNHGIRAIDAELGELVRGDKPGRRTPEDIILVNPFGLAIEDLAIASEVVALASASGVGLRLPR